MKAFINFLKISAVLLLCVIFSLCISMVHLYINHGVKSVAAAPPVLTSPALHPNQISIFSGNGVVTIQDQKIKSWVPTQAPVVRHKCKARKTCCAAPASKPVATATDSIKPAQFYCRQQPQSSIAQNDSLLYLFNFKMVI